MHPIKAIPLLAAAVSAIDIHFYTSRTCSGAFLTCSGVAPGYCCWVGGSDYLSLGIHAIPTDWNVVGQAFRHGECATEVNSGGNNGYPDICIRDPLRTYYSGGKYQFRNRIADTGAAESGTCNPVKPDLLVLEDGQRYNISGLDDTLLNPLIEYAFNGSTADAIPEVYKNIAIGA